MGRDQILIGVIGQEHRGFWLSTEHFDIATRDLNGIFIDDIVLRTPEGEPVSRIQLEWGARVVKALNMSTSFPFRCFLLSKGGQVEHGIDCPDAALT